MKQVLKPDSLSAPGQLYPALGTAFRTLHWDLASAWRCWVGPARLNPDAAGAPCRFEKVDQLKQEMRRKKELERRLRLGDASKGDEDAAEQDNVRRMPAAVLCSMSCRCGVRWVTGFGPPAHAPFRGKPLIVGSQHRHSATMRSTLPIAAPTMTTRTASGKRRPLVRLAHKLSFHGLGVTVVTAAGAAFAIHHGCAQHGCSMHRLMSRRMFVKMRRAFTVLAVQALVKSRSGCAPPVAVHPGPSATCESGRTPPSTS